MIRLGAEVEFGIQCADSESAREVLIGDTVVQPAISSAMAADFFDWQVWPGVVRLKTIGRRAIRTSRTPKGYFAITEGGFAAAWMV